MGTQCAVPQNYAATVNYSCPGGDPLSGSTCLKTTVYTATPSYSCPSGGSLNGTSCTVTSAYAATPDYSCTGADILNGSTCTRTATIAATPAYSCPNGAAPPNGQCTGTNSTSTAYIYLGGKQIAETVIGGATQYVHTDALGSPVAHTSQAGAETSRTKFEPYGYTAGGTKPGPAMAGMPTTGSAIGFTGHVNDPETDLVYMQQRYYDPIAGRFMSVDPVVANGNTGGSFNRYNYANNNPYLFTDPDGRCGTTEGLTCFTTVSEGPNDSNAGGGGGNGEAKPIAGKANAPYFTGNTYIDSATLDLNAMALLAEKSVGEGSGAVHGTLVHTAFARLVRAANRSDLHAEQSFDFDGLVHYGLSGSIRTDVTLGPDKRFPVAIYDLKTGSARLTDSRVNQINKRFPFHRVVIMAIYPGVQPKKKVP